MKNLMNENAIAEAAYYIWQNNGCPANTSSCDWNAAINQLSNLSALAASSSKKAAAMKVSATVKTLAPKATAGRSTAKKATKSAK